MAAVAGELRLPVRGSLEIGPPFLRYRSERGVHDCMRLYVRRTDEVI